MDTNTTIQYLKDVAAQLVKEREWDKFHNPKNISMDISIEAGELMEKFLWALDTKESFAALEKNRQDVEDELADILIAVVCFANVCSIDISKAFDSKIEEIKKKYPVELVRGKSEKYTHYQSQQEDK